MAKSSASSTEIRISGCLEQQSSRLSPIQSVSCKREMTSAHIGTVTAVSALPMMYIPCLARDRATLILFGVRKNPTLCSTFDRTKLRMTTSASLPWKLSIVESSTELKSDIFLVDAEVSKGSSSIPCFSMSSRSRSLTVTAKMLLSACRSLRSWPRYLRKKC